MSQRRADPERLEGAVPTTTAGRDHTQLGGGKSAGSEPTGEEQAAANRDMDPPA